MFRGLASCPDLMCRNLKFRDFKRGDFPGVLKYLNAVDWIKRPVTLTLGCP